MPGFDANLGSLSLSQPFQLPSNFGSGTSGVSSSMGSFPGLSIAGMIGNLFYSEYNRRKNEQYTRESWAQQEKMTEAAQRYATAEAAKQRAASSLTSLYNQMKQLGLNTDLLYSGGASQGGMTAASASVPGTPSQVSTGVSPLFQTGSLSELAMMNAQTKLIEAQTREINARADSQEFDNSSYQRDLRTAAANMSIKQLSAVTDNLRAITKLTGQQVREKVRDNYFIDLLYHIQTNSDGSSIAFGELADNPGFQKMLLEYKALTREYEVKTKIPAVEQIRCFLEVYKDLGHNPYMFKNGHFSKLDFSYTDDFLADLGRKLQKQAVKLGQPAADNADLNYWVNMASGVIGALVSAIGKSR